MKKSITLFIMLFFVALTAVNAQVFITELADPNNNAEGRYIELYNAGTSAVDFTEGSNWRIDKYTNASATVSQTLNLTGTIPAGGFYIIAAGVVDGDFLTLYGVDADQFDGADNDVAGSNGDDNLELYDGTGTLVDQFGVPGEDGTGTNHEFEDGRAERVASVTTGNAVWDVTEWYIDSDAGTGDGPQDAPDGFDPGVWNPQEPVVKTPIVLTIYQIQYTDSTDGDSEYIDSLVTTTGVVTALTSSGFYCQDSASSWNGIFVNTTNTVALGDDVTVTGTVQESYGFTQITSVTDVTNNGTGVVPTALTVSTGEASAEMYESVLLSTSGTCDNPDLGYGEWSINDGTGSARFDDLMYAVTPTLGWNYEVTGLLTYSYSAFKILPRDADDVVETELTNDLFITFEDDSEVTLWSHFDEGNLYTTEAYNATAGVGGSGALELGDAGYGMIDKRKVYTTSGTPFSLSVDIKTQGWAVPETYKLFLYAQDFAVLDSVQVNSDSGFTTFTLTGTSIADSGYIRIAGSNVAGQNYIWIDNLIFDDDAVVAPVHPYFIAGDFQGWDAASTPLYDDGTNGDQISGDGIYSLEYSVATSGAHLWKVTNGTWDTTWPAANSWFSSTTDAQTVLFTFNSNSVGDGWLPDQYICNTGEEKPTELVAVGDFQSEEGDADWNNASTITAMRDDGLDGDLVSGDGIFCYHMTSLPAGSYSAKGVKAGEWNGWGADGRSVDAQNIDFTTTSNNQDVYLYVNVNTGRTFLTFEAITPIAFPKVFFSEYIEGGGNNKALEIYNGTGSEINLSDYVIRINSNGSDWSSVFAFNPNEKLAAGEVFVIAHAEAVSEITAVADTLIVNPYSGGVSYVAVFNGDDVRALCYVSGTDTTTIDIIGAYDGVDPGSGWSVAGIADGTKDHSIIRKPSVTAGNSDWAASAGTTTEDSEWEVYDKDTFKYLGQHPGIAFPKVFFSEYIEGGGNNKALEIYNGSGSEINLSDYVIRINSNGSDWSSVFAFNPNEKLAAGEVFVIAHAEAVSEITAVADTLIVNPYSGGVSYVAVFNGDDVRALCYVSGTDTTTIDIIGAYDGVDPGSGWPVAGITDGTKDHTIVRKEVVTHGNPVWTVSAGTSTEDSEWEVYDKDTFDYLGQHPGAGVAIKPEPSEYPTNFTAVANGTSILITWTDAAGTQIPDGYVGMINTSGVFPSPVDGVQVEDSDSTKNISFGVETILATELDPETIYYFALYPYTNSGSDIDYKTDGTVPVVFDTTGVAPNPIQYSNFESGLGDWTGYSVTSTNVWGHATGTGANGTSGFAQMNGYQEDVISNDYLIAGPFNLNNFTEEYMQFWAATKYGDFDKELTLEYSTDFDGSADPSAFTWNTLTFTRPIDNNDTWSNSGVISLSEINADLVYIAFHYLSDGTQGRWKIDEVGIYGIPEHGVDLPPVVESVSRTVIIPDANQSTEVTAVVTDDNGVSSVNLVYSNDGSTLNSVPMSNTSGDTWVGSVPESLYNDGDLFGYLVAAMDNSGQVDTSEVTMLFAGNTPISNIKMQTEDGALEFTGAMAKVTGTVSAGTGTYSTGRIEAYMQDETAGVLVIAFGTETPSMVEGNSYTVTGKIIQYNGLIEIEPATPETDILDNGAVTAVEPISLTIDQINANPEEYEGRLVKVDGAELSSTTEWLDGNTSGSTMKIFVSSDTLDLRVDADTDIWGTTSPEFPQDITGVLGQYDSSSPYTSGYQLMPRRLTDFDNGVGVDDENGLPSVYALEQNYPNPFNPSTKINFSLPESGMVTMKVFDILGREVATLIHEEMVASYHTVEFNASQLTSGIYFYKIQVNDFVSVKKMILMK